MELEREEVDYRTLTASVIPRPIAWVSTRSPDGVDNLAPFSFFTIASITPPVLFFSPTKYDRRKPDRFKDTPRNVRESGEFVVNVVTGPLLERMNETSARLPAGESEFDRTDVERAESTLVAPPRVADADVAFECTLYESLQVGRSAPILGEVVHAHVDDALLDEDGLDVTRLDAVGRLTGGYYAPLDPAEYVSLERPP